MGIQSITKTYQLTIERKQQTLKAFLFFWQLPTLCWYIQEKGNGRLSNVALVVVTENSE